MTAVKILKNKKVLNLNSVSTRVAGGVIYVGQMMREIKENMSL